MNTFAKKSDADLHKELTEKKSDLQRFRFGMAGSKTRDVKRGRDLHRDIARILTELSRRHRESSNT